MAKQHKFFGYYTTLAIVVANMVGTGVFTTLGLQAIDIQSGFALIFHIVTTILKLIVIIGFCAVGFLVHPVEALLWVPNGEAITEMFTASFALSLIYVSYAFSGWNAATYVASEVSHPQRTIPQSLLHGVGLVTLLYLLLNYVFLRTIPSAELAGKIEIGALSAEYIFGPQGGTVISAVLCSRRTPWRLRRVWRRF